MLYAHCPNLLEEGPVQILLTSSFCKAYFSLTLPLPPTHYVDNSDLPSPLNDDRSLTYYSPYYSPALRDLT